VEQEDTRARRTEQESKAWEASRMSQIAPCWSREPRQTQNHCQR